MALNSSGFTKTVELATAKTPQLLEPSGTTPGSENPQTASVIVKAKPGNVGSLFVGFSKAEVEAEGAGFELAKGEAISLDLNGLGNVWFNGPNKDKLMILGVGP